MEAWVSWNPKSQQVATIGGVFDAATGARLWTQPGWRMCWSPDGERLALVDDSQARILSAKGGTMLVELTGHPAKHRAISFSPGGDFLAIAGDDNTVSIWDATRGTQLSALRGHTDWVLDVKWSPDGKQLATAGNGTFKIWDWPVRLNPEVVTSQASALRSLAWNNDGSAIAVGGGNDVMKCDVATLKTRRCLTELRAEATDFQPSIGWHSTSHLFATRRAASTVLFDDQTWQGRREIDDRDRNVRALDLSPDGTRIAISAAGELYTDNSVLRVFSSATGQELWAAKLDLNVAGCLRFSPDGTASHVVVGRPSRSSTAAAASWSAATRAARNIAGLAPRPGIRRVRKWRSQAWIAAFTSSTRPREENNSL